jgi:hypothetical protein
MASLQCSSLKCAHAFQREGLQNNHTSLKLSIFFATLHKKELDIGHFELDIGHIVSKLGVGIK